jgi:membrane protease YdiL (CAAX protease family)
MSAAGIAVRAPGRALALVGPTAAWALLAVTTFVAFATMVDSPEPSRIAIMLLAAPILEEAIFRAGLQEWLLRRRVPAGWANVATAATFAAAHCVARGVELLSLAAFVPALALGWVYGRHRSLRLCIALHMVMNIAWVEWSQGALPWLRSF